MKIAGKLENLKLSESQRLWR